MYVCVLICSLPCRQSSGRWLIADADVLFFLGSPRSVVLTVQLRQRRQALAVREGAQGASGEEFPQTAGPDFVRAQHPSILLRGSAPAWLLCVVCLFVLHVNSNYCRLPFLSLFVYVCVTGCCQRFILAVWQRSVSGAERPPGVLPGVWTQTVQVLQTSWKTGWPVFLRSFSFVYVCFVDFSFT